MGEGSLGPTAAKEEATPLLNFAASGSACPRAQEAGDWIWRQWPVALGTGRSMFPLLITVNCPGSPGPPCIIFTSHPTFPAQLWNRRFSRDGGRGQDGHQETGVKWPATQAKASELPAARSSRSYYSKFLRKLLENK